MANIQNELNNIKTALYGKDVRNSIHDAIKTCYDDASVNNDNANMEVKLARGTHNTLNDRLCEVDEKQNSLSSQLAHKANLNSVFNMANMGQDIKEAMTGGSVAVIGDNMANENNLSNNCINFHKHSSKYPLLLRKNFKNLFNKNTATIGYYVNRQNGELIANDSYFTSDFIYVSTGSYIKNNIEQCAFYDANKNYLRSGNTGELQEVTSDVSYIKVCGLVITIDTFQFERGTVKTAYEPFVDNYKHSVKDYFTKESIIESIENHTFKPALQSKNLFNKNTVTFGYYVDRQTGSIKTNKDYFASDFIKVEPNTLYRKTNSEQFALYDENLIFIPPAAPVGSEINTYPNAKYIKICGLLNTLDKTMLVKGDELGIYEPYKSLISLSQIEPFTNTKTVKSIMSKLVMSENKLNVKLIGDSITHGEGGTGFKQDGELIMNIAGTTWNVNTNGYCWANKFKNYLMQKFNCVVKNYRASGANSKTIVNGLEQLIDGTEDIVICTIGTNDRHNNTKLDYVENIKTIYNYCNSRNIDVIFMSNIPSSVYVETERPKWHMEDVDMLLMKASYELDIEYISLYKLFLDYCIYTDTTIDSLLIDGLHPNDAGYDVMFYLICNALGMSVRRPNASWND